MRINSSDLATQHPVERIGAGDGAGVASTRLQRQPRAVSVELGSPTIEIDLRVPQIADEDDAVLAAFVPYLVLKRLPRHEKPSGTHSITKASQGVAKRGKASQIESSGSSHCQR